MMTQSVGRAAHRKAAVGDLTQAQRIV